MPLQQCDSMERLAAEATREFLAVCCDVALELHLRPKCLPTEDALAGLESCVTEVRFTSANVMSLMTVVAHSF